MVKSRVDLTKFDAHILVEASEERKTLERCITILEELARFKCRKDVMIYAIGGGIVQDLVTLVASLYLRGVKWTFIPTTLVAALDSCLGGKSSINLRSYKNIG